MAFGIIHHFPGGTKEQYESSVAAVHPSKETLPGVQGGFCSPPQETEVDLYSVRP